MNFPTRPHTPGGDGRIVTFRAASGQLLSVDLSPLTHAWLLLVPKPAAEVDQGGGGRGGLRRWLTGRASALTQGRSLSSL